MKRSRKAVTNLRTERTILLRSLLAAERNWFAMCRNFRDAGRAWIRIKRACSERGISVGQWANDNAHLSKR
jgi:hypothetical protein